MATIGYRFDGDIYRNDEAGRQSLLEDISTALQTEAWSDPDLTTEEDREEAANMAFDGTHYAADFWDNIVSIMQQAPYPIEVERIDESDALEEYERGYLE